MIYKTDSMRQDYIEELLSSFQHVLLFLHHCGKLFFKDANEKCLISVNLTFSSKMLSHIHDHRKYAFEGLNPFY